jgi:uncharacterized membrane protein
LVQRIRSWWFDLQQGLWFVPSTMTLMAALLAFATIKLDEGVLADRSIRSWWFFAGGAEGARGVLTAIAGTMITVATTVFSITIVALQLGSSQFSPRILRGFTRDRGNQLVLGGFIATFVYTLLVLRTVQSETADLQVFVPAASVTLAMLLAIGAIGSLIFYFHHATRTIQAPVVIDRAASDTFALIEARLDETTDENISTVAPGEVVPRDDMFTIASGRSGYITGIDMDALLNLAGKHDVVITVVSHIGAHVLSSTVLAEVPEASLRSGPDDCHDQFADRVARAFAFEIERTLEHDLLLSFRQVSDIAIKALSPGINDPTTAVICIDRLGEALLRARDIRQMTVFHGVANGHGGVRYTTIGYQDIVNECLPQIRHYAAGDVVVVRHLLHVLREVATHSEGEAAEILADQARLIVEEAIATLSVAGDRELVREDGRWAE